MTGVIFWGATGQARVLREAISYAGLEPAVLFDDRELSSPFPGVPIHIGEAGFLKWMALSGTSPYKHCCVAIGGSHGADRVRIQRWLAGHGVAPLTVIHPTAFVAGHAVTSTGCQILAMAAVCTGARLGEATIINTSASVDHDSVLGAGVHIGPGARLAGEVVVDDGAFIGAGAVILPRIHIGANAIVGAGAVVTRDVPANLVVVGNPARVIRRIP